MSPSATSNGLSQSVRFINLSYDNTESERSARQLVFTLYPEWESSPGEIEFVRFKDGITNTVRLEQSLERNALLLISGPAL